MRDSLGKVDTENRIFLINTTENDLIFQKFRNKIRMKFSLSTNGRNLEKVEVPLVFFVEFCSNKRAKDRDFISSVLILSEILNFIKTAFNFRKIKNSMAKHAAELLSKPKITKRAVSC